MDFNIDENGYIIEPEQINQEYQSSFFLMLRYDMLIDNRLSDFQRILYAAITGLCKQKGYCWASNAYFEKLFNKGNTQVSTGISKLVELGYIKREMVYKKKKDKNGDIITTKEIAYRKLYIVGMEPNQNTGILENQNTGSLENQKEIDNPIIDNLTSNNLSKDILLEDNTETVVYNIGEDNNYLDNKKKDDEINNGIFSDSENSAYILKTPATTSEKIPPKKKGGLAPLYDMVDDKYTKAKYPTLNVGLKTYLKAHLGKRRLPSIEKWTNMLKQLEEYSSVQLPGTIGVKFMEAKAIEIVEKAINGKDGVPYLEFDDIFKTELNEPTFDLNRNYTKGY